jgi:hypothetical protein
MVYGEMGASSVAMRGLGQCIKANCLEIVRYTDIVEKSCKK